MKLITMWKVDSTVDADGRSPVAERLLEDWEHDQGSTRFFRSSANFVYVFRREGKAHFLRFADSSERTREAIAAEAELLNWLVGAGIDVASPVESRHGSFVETTATDLGTFHAVLFTALEGSQLDLEDLDDSQFRAWGAALGKLHSAMKGYSGAGLSARSTWRDRLELAGEYIPESEPAIRRELDRIASSLSTLPVDADNYGLIHFDFELDNLYWRDSGIGTHAYPPEKEIEEASW